MEKCIYKTKSFWYKIHSFLTVHIFMKLLKSPELHGCPFSFCTKINFSPTAIFHKGAPNANKRKNALDFFKFPLQCFKNLAVIVHIYSPFNTQMTWVLINTFMARALKCLSFIQYIPGYCGLSSSSMCC